MALPPPPPGFFSEPRPRNCAAGEAEVVSAALLVVARCALIHPGCGCALRSLRPTGRFATSCSSVDHAGASSPAGTGLVEEREFLPFFKLSSDFLRTELSLLKEDDAPSSSSPLLTAVLPVRTAPAGDLTPISSIKIPAACC